MFKIEKSCSEIANYICSELSFNEEKKAVVSYGLFALLQTIYSFLLVFIIGCLFNVAKEALLITLAITILRKASGGTHASTSISCLIIGTMISIIPAILIKYGDYNLKLNFILTIIIFAIAYIIVYRKAPVDSINKPIKTEAKRKRLKKASIKILSYYLTIVIIAIVVAFKTANTNILAYTICIEMGVCLQIFSLTKIGRNFFYVIDKLINIILGGKR